MKLTDQPIYDPDPERTERELHERLVRWGRTARKLGHANDPAPFRFEDWQESWSRGWREEDEKIKREEEAARRRKSPTLADVVWTTVMMNDAVRRGMSDEERRELTDEIVGRVHQYILESVVGREQEDA
jgi:hypothetical protein